MLVLTFFRCYQLNGSRSVHMPAHVVYVNLSLLFDGDTIPGWRGRTFQGERGYERCTRWWNC